MNYTMYLENPAGKYMYEHVYQSHPFFKKNPNKLK